MTTKQPLPKCLVTAAALATYLAAADARAASCSFSSVVGVAFGTYDVFDPAPLDSSGNMTIVCSGLATTDLITIELGMGSAPSGINRHMLNGSISLGYNLYLDAARTLVWGNGSNGTVTQGPSSITNDTPTTFTVYGRIPSQQNVSAGSYADSITVTVLF